MLCQNTEIIGGGSQFCFHFICMDLLKIYANGLRKKGRRKEGKKKEREIIYNCSERSKGNSHFRSDSYESRSPCQVQ